MTVFIPPGEQLFSLYAEGALMRREGDADDFGCGNYYG